MAAISSGLHGRPPVWSEPLLLLRGVDPTVGGVIYSPLGWTVLAVTIILVLRSGGLTALLYQQASEASASSIVPG